MDSLPLAFGKGSKANGPRAVLDSAAVQGGSVDRNVQGSDMGDLQNRSVGPSTHSIPANAIQSQQQQEEEEDDDHDDDDLTTALDNADEDPFPITHSVELKDHTKACTALAINGAGSRIVSGSHDYECKLWDFGGMNLSFRPFKSLEPTESHPIRHLAWSGSGDRFLCSTGEPQIKLFDLAGEMKTQFVRGDMYLRDMKHTVGHTAQIYESDWDPASSERFITCAADSTVRLWDANDKYKNIAVGVIKSKQRGGRTRVTAVKYSANGKIIAAGSHDGSIHLYANNGSMNRPNLSLVNAHEREHHLSAIVWHADGQTLASRSMDGSVKLWDRRKFTRPVGQATVPCGWPESNVIFSADGTQLLVPSAERNAQNSQHYISVLGTKQQTLKEERQILVGDSAPIRVIWHTKINQILVSTASGAIQVHYSPTKSIRGAIMPTQRGHKKRSIEEVLAQERKPVIQTPDALPMFQEDTLINQRRLKGKERSDPMKTKRPEPPLQGPGKGGRVGASATQHLVQSLVRERDLEEDPREALLKYATEEEKKNSKWSEKWGKSVPTDTPS